MTKHAIAQPVAVKQRAELRDIIRQMLRRYAGILRERNRLGGPFCITQQTDGFFAHRVDTLHARQLSTQLPANDASFLTGN
ncbi:hypothetical protein D3C73_1492090 [compost metagenome]